MKEIRISRNLIFWEVIILLLLIAFVIVMYIHDVPVEFILLISINVFGFNTLYVVKKIYHNKNHE